MEIELEEKETEISTGVKTGMAEILGMTKELRTETESYIENIDPEASMDRIHAIKGELATDRAEVAGYLAEIVSLKDRLKMGASLEDTQTFIDKVKGLAASVVGLRKGFASMSDGEIINLLVKEFGMRSHYISERIDHVLEKREEAGKHMNFLKANRSKAIPMMLEAESGFREMHKEKVRLEARLAQNLSLEVRERVEDEYDLLKDSWFVEGEKLSESTYTVELSSNVLGVMRVYKDNIDNLLREAGELKRIVDMTVETIKPSMKSIVSVAGLAQEVTDTVTAHDVLREYLNSVLPKITEMTSYFPELIGESFDGQFFKEGLEDYLRKCDNKYHAIKDYTLVKKLEKARETLKKEGIEIPDFNAEELVFDHGPKPDDEPLDEPGEDLLGELDYKPSPNSPNGDGEE